MVNNDSNNITQQKIIVLMRENNKYINVLTKQGNSFEHHFSEFVENQKALQQRLENKSEKIPK